MSYLNGADQINDRIGESLAEIFITGMEIVSKQYDKVCPISAICYNTLK
jgi:hypothetical protein